jgi:hypothetical protein
MEKRLQKP